MECCPLQDPVRIWEEEAYCDHCANCRPEMKLPETAGAGLVQAAADLLRKSHVPIEPRKQWADAGRAAARFGLSGKNTIPLELRMEEGRSLSLYGAGEWGRLVQIGKYETNPPRFDDRLVEACAQMLAEWVPLNCPRWVVPIPSRRNNALVGDFAMRLARRLGLPCCRCLTKIADTPPTRSVCANILRGRRLRYFTTPEILNSFLVEEWPLWGRAI